MSPLNIVPALTLVAACWAQTPGWKLAKPTSWPSARSNHAMAYDSARQRTVLFGGELRTSSGSSVFADTWEWDGNNWAQLKPTVSPPARLPHVMAYDAARRRTILFGGFDPRGSGSFLGDTWEWDGNNWTQRKPTTSPPARYLHAMAYDSLRQRTVLFGGVGSRYMALKDTWEWDGNNWTQRKPANAPGYKYRHCMAYDSARRRTVLFGDASVANKPETWEWDGNNWTQRKPTTSPTALPRLAMAYDAARQRTVLFGGLGPNSRAQADTWEWGGSNWTQIKPTSPPSARVDHAMAYDSVRQRVVLFSGAFFPQAPDTWEYGNPRLTLTADKPTISIANGGTQLLGVDAGAGLGGKLYWVFGSATSTLPGVVIAGIHIPLRPDPYTDFGIATVNSGPFVNFKGVLSATGTATASLNVPAKLPIPPGFKLYHACVVYGGKSGQLYMSSNPASVQFK